MYDMKNLAKVKTLGELAPEAVQAFLAFNDAVFQDGAIPVKYKELISVAVAVTTQCPYCIEDHAKRARKAGASEAELAEATMVAAYMSLVTPVFAKTIESRCSKKLKSARLARH